MKLCYLDESGTGSEPFAVMASVIVDGSRMHITKKDWKELLIILSKVINRKVKEFHTRDFYFGNGIWRGLDGNERALIISRVLKWLKDRKHKICFSAVDKNKYFSDFQNNQKLKDIGSLWCFLALHHLLIIQKHHQNNSGVKGHTLCIFDNEEREKNRIIELSINAPDWTNTYYAKKDKLDKLSHIVDVPYFGNSEKIHLLQIADLLAYIIRVYIEIKEGKSSPRYKDEADKIDSWMHLICELSIPFSMIYPKKGRCECSELFYQYAPITLLDLV